MVEQYRIKVNFQNVNKSLSADAFYKSTIITKRVNISSLILNIYISQMSFYKPYLILVLAHG